MFNIQKIVKKGEYLYAVVPEHPNANKYGYVLAHRVVMENILGRLLERGEVVHHKDGNKHNNDPDNLQLMTAKEHCKHHQGLKSRTTVTLHCTNCGKEFKRYKNLVHQGDAFCSRRCNGTYQRNHNWHIKQASIA